MGFSITKRFLQNHELTKNNLLQAYYRYFKWQLISRLHNTPFEYPFIEKAKLWVTKGMTGATGNIYAGLHEFKDMAFLLHFLRKEDSFADIGSNIGSYTILASAVVGASTTSFEPIPSTFNFLQKNININKCSSIVTANNKGVGKEKSVLRFSNSFDTINHVLTNDDSVTSFVEIEVETLDSYFEKNINSLPAIIKIDVEGFESDVLTGASNILYNKTLKAIIIELNGCCHKYGVYEKDIHEILISYGFKPYDYSPFARTLLQQITYSNGGNTIYIRDIEFVKERVQNSRKYKAVGKFF